jgi:hypothetical protein
MWLVRERERDNDGAMLTGSEERRRGVRIEPTTEGNVGGRHTSTGVSYMRGGGEIGGVGVWYSGEWSWWCPFYRENGG